jgi:DNA-binding CsgD family transcriptional regulator
VRQRLVATDRAEQPAIDRAIAGAIARPGRLALAALTGGNGRRYLLQVHPVPGKARDIFSSAAALALLLQRDRKRAPIRTDFSGLRSAYGLTEQETNVVALLAEGLDLNGIAAQLEIRPNTARSYLKDALQKTGTSRQAELVALVARI